MRASAGETRDSDRRRIGHVPSTHDRSYRDALPEGCNPIDGRFVTWSGVHLLGPDGSGRYNDRPEPYAERGMELRILGLTRFCGHLNLWGDKPRI